MTVCKKCGGNQGICECSGFNAPFEGSIQKKCRMCGKPWKCNGNVPALKGHCAPDFCNFPVVGPCCITSKINEGCYKCTPYYDAWKWRLRPR